MQQFRQQILSAIPSLKPCLDDEQNEIHFSQNYKGYVVNLEFIFQEEPELLKRLGLTGSLEQLCIRGKQLLHSGIITAYEKECIRFVYMNACQVYAHNVFWSSFNSKYYGSYVAAKVTTDLKNSYPWSLQQNLFVSRSKDAKLETRLRKLELDLSKIEKKELVLRETMASACRIIGSGWVWIAKSRENKIHIIPKQSVHNILDENGLSPLIAIDLWEHAYYARYVNDKDLYVKNLLDIMNWSLIT